MEKAAGDSKPEMCYLGSPYSHKMATIKELRYKAAVVATAKLMSMGRMVFSPIAHSHRIAGALEAYAARDESGAWRTWAAFDLHMLGASSVLLILVLRDWEQSVGLQSELAHAKSIGLAVEFVLPEDLGLDFDALFNCNVLMPTPKELYRVNCKEKYQHD